jgi:mRNA interferase RelE/StbE
VSDLYEIVLSPAARRALTTTLPEIVATATWQLINGPLRADPYRVGKPLRPPLDGQYVARRSTYRVFYRVDDRRRLVTVLGIKARADAYHTF